MYTRYAIYYLPPPGALASFGARWLGWDVVMGEAVPHYDVPALSEATKAPRKYGFHGTLKPPFRLADGTDAAALKDAVGALAARLVPAQSSGLGITRLGRFLALVPQADQGDLGRVADACVMTLDDFRAPATADELAKRRKANLTPAQDALLLQWGYPYVCEAFRFHMTLTGRLPAGDLEGWAAQTAAKLPALSDPFVLDAIALVGERADGRFELIERFPLKGR